MPEHQVERLSRIWRRWPRSFRTQVLAQRSDWSISFPVGTLCLVASLYLEQALWEFGFKLWWPLGLIAGHPACWGAVGLMIVWNGWIMACYLENPLAWRLPRWLRGICVVAAGIPLLGMFAIPAWHRLLSNPPAWLRARLRPEPELDLDRVERTVLGAGPRLLLQRLQDRVAFSPPGMALSYLAGQIAPVLVLLIWLTGADRLHAPGRWAVLAACVIFHLIAAGSFLVYERFVLKFSGSRAWLGLCLCLLLLLPNPLAILVWGFLFLEPSREPDVNDFFQSFDRPPTVPARRLWTLVPRPLENRLPVRWSRPWWRRERVLREPLRDERGEVGESERRRRLLYRLKIGLLFLDSGALGWWLSRLDWPVVSRSTVVAVSLALAVLGLIISAVAMTTRGPGLRKFGNLLGGSSLGFTLTLTQITFLAGLITGSLLAMGGTAEIKQLQVIRMLIAYVFLLGAVLGILVAASLYLTSGGDPKRVRRANNLVILSVIPVGLFMLFAVSVADGEVDRFFRSSLRWAFWLSPVWNLALGLWLGGWLLYPQPLRLRLLSRGVPWPLRGLPALLSFTAVLPLGGLAIPFWIFARHRWWPEFVNARTMASPNS